MEKLLIVRIVVRTPQGSLLLLKRSPLNAWSPLRYELPGGKVNPAETELIAAVKREVVEETGIEVISEPKIVHVLTEEWQGMQYIIAAYEIEVEKELSIKLSREHEAFAWTTANELSNFELTSHTAEIIRAAFKAETSLESRWDASDNNKIIIYTDGGSRGNPGPSASGYIIVNDQEKVLEEGGEYLGITTNNQAEYQAVKLALEQAKKYSPKDITFRIDSELVVKQLNGQYQIRNRDLWPIHAHIKELIKEYHKVSFIHVRREMNSLADAKVNEILDSRSI